MNKKTIKNPFGNKCFHSSIELVIFNLINIQIFEII